MRVGIQWIPESVGRPHSLLGGDFLVWANAAQEIFDLLLALFSIHFTIIIQQPMRRVDFSWVRGAVDDASKRVERLLRREWHVVCTICQVCRGSVSHSSWLGSWRPVCVIG